MIPWLQPIRLTSIGAFALWLAVIAVTYDFVPEFRNAWGVNLLAYLPDWQGWLLALLALLMTTEEARRGAVRGASAVGAAFGRLPRPAAELLLLAALAGIFWTFREQHLFGDSRLNIGALNRLQQGSQLPMATIVLGRGLVRAGSWLGLSTLHTIQLCSCALGAGAAVLLVRAGRDLAGVARGGVWLPLIVGSAGLARSVAGRVEVQPLLLFAAAAFMAAAASTLAGRGPRRTAALALGVGITLHPLFLFLLPALLALPWLVGERAGSPVRAAAVALAWTLVPPLVYAAVLVVSGRAELTQIAQSVFRSSLWVRGPFGGRGFHTNYTWLELRHWKYLSNAFWLLAPGSLLLLPGFMIRSRRQFVATPSMRFMCVATAGLLIGATWSRPFFGPFDWDHLTVPALFAASLAALLIAGLPDEKLRGQLGTAVVALQLLLIGLPLLLMAIATAHEAGPFAQDAMPNWFPIDRVAAPKSIRPWL